MPLKSASLFGNILSLTVLLCAFAMNPASVASAQKATPRPCDLFASATPCVAAISTTRALYSAYTGPLYQVTRQSDKTHTSIGLLPDGYANAAAQDTFCADTTCTINRLYDQSSNHNDLTPAPPGGAARGPGPNGYDLPAVANALPATVAGHKVYGIAISPGMGYRNDSPKGTAVHPQLGFTHEDAFMPWKETRTVDLRLQFLSSYQREEMYKTDLCHEYGISRPTAYKWIKRYDEVGPEGLLDLTHTPHSSPYATSAEIENEVLALRKRFPSWGARKLKARLERMNPKVSWPAASAVVRSSVEPGSLTRRGRNDAPRPARNRSRWSRLPISFGPWISARHDGEEDEMS